MSGTAQQAPFYVLLAHSSALVHPVIQYKYADDSPSNLLPTSVDENVIVLDFDPPTAKSLSRSIAVTSLKLEDALGVADEAKLGTRHDKIHIIETTVADQRPADLAETEPAEQVLAEFKDRNALMRRVLVYPQQ